jgi:Fe2+ or Zn2+ uptake regulation protein
LSCWVESEETGGVLMRKAEANTKLRVLLIERLLRRNPQGLTVPEILAALERNNISANRKTIYDDLAILTLLYPVDVRREGMRTIYFLLESKYLH